MTSGRSGLVAATRLNLALPDFVGLPPIGETAPAKVAYAATVFFLTRHCFEYI
jgi:hypothetical protein